MLNDLLLHRLDALETSSQFYNIPKHAFFDMDNTLLVGDIGELIILAMLNENMNLNMSWNDYLNLLNTEGEGIAYRKIIEAKAGNTPESIKNLVHKLLDDIIPYVFNDYIKDKPRQNTTLKSLLGELNKRDFEIFLITSSSQFVAEAVVEKWYPEIKLNNVFGVKNKLVDNLLIEDLEEPIPIREGKAVLVNGLLNGEKALLTAGDSINDIYMLNHTHQHGLKLIVDHKPEKTFQILKNLENLDNMFFIDWK